MHVVPIFTSAPRHDRPGSHTGDTEIDHSPHPQSRDFHHHPRDWRGSLYVYPVISRRSQGLSLGVNLNPDTACNFDCIYCQVERTTAPRVRDVDLDVLRRELDVILAAATSGALFDGPEFTGTSASLRRLNDIAFSGDGEPTTCPVFTESVQLAADLKAEHGLTDAKLVLITDACYLTKPSVRAALEIMDRANGQIWAKLDAGTEEYFRRVNRPNFSLEHVVDNITQAARVRPITIQSLFMRVNERPPDEVEIRAYVGRLSEMLRAGAQVRAVQVYTVARRPADPTVTPLDNDELDAIATSVAKHTRLPVQTYYG